jgi:hypothetical protein
MEVKGTLLVKDCQTGISKRVTNNNIGMAFADLVDKLGSDEKIDCGNLYAPCKGLCFGWLYKLGIAKYFIIIFSADQ